MSTVYKDEVNTQEAYDEYLDDAADRNEDRHLVLPKTAKARVICIASGKGGTGKTVLSTNMAVLLAEQGLNVALLDADFGLANSHLLMGVDPVDDVSSVFSGEKKLEDVIIEGPSGVKLIPGGSGLSELTMLGDDKFRRLIDELYSLEAKMDVVIIDLSAGISPQVLCMLGAAHEIILVTTPEVTSLVDGYALIKSLTKMNENPTIHIVVNKAPDKDRAIVAFQKMWSVVNKHLKDQVSVKFFGWLPRNWYVQNSVASRKPLVLRHPMCFATRNLEQMALKTIKRHRQWLDVQAGHEADPSYFTRLEQMVYG